MLLHEEGENLSKEGLESGIAELCQCTASIGFMWPSVSSAELAQPIETQGKVPRNYKQPTSKQTSFQQSVSKTEWQTQLINLWLRKSAFPPHPKNRIFQNLQSIPAQPIIIALTEPSIGERRKSSSPHPSGLQKTELVSPIIKAISKNLLLHSTILLLFEPAGLPLLFLLAS